MQRRETDWPKRLNDNPAGAELVAMVRRDVHGTEGVVKDENAYACLGALPQNLAERICHTTGGTVIQLQGDRPLCRSQVFPQAWIGGVAVQHHLDTVTEREPCA